MPKSLNQLARRQQLLYLMMFTFATILVWVAISLFSSQKKTQISPELQALAKPLNPTLNRSILDRIGTKRSLNY